MLLNVTKHTHIPNSQQVSFTELKIEICIKLRNANQHHRNHNCIANVSYEWNYANCIDLPLFLRWLRSPAIDHHKHGSRNDSLRTEMKFI